MPDEDKAKKRGTQLGLVIGAGMGIVLGLLFGNIAIGIPVGAGVGLVFGMLFDRQKSKSDDT